MKVNPLKDRLVIYVTRHNLTRKLNKQIKLLEENSNHPSLNTEKLEPKDFNLYSFRIDRKYRAVFSIIEADEIEIIDVNDHYQ